MEDKIKQPKRKVVSSYTIVYNKYDDGSDSLKRTNKGIDFLTLFGIVSLIKGELFKMWEGSHDFTPKVIERVYIHPKE